MMIPFSDRLPACGIVGASVVVLVGLCLACTIFAQTPVTHPATSQPAGELILRPFEHAPFPHPSRKDGWKYQDKFFPADAHYSDSTIGIFIPRTFAPGDKVDLVVHFHGWGNNVANCFAQFDLQNQMIQSRRNAILLVPQGPKDASDSGGGKMEDPGGFERMIREVVEYLHKTGKIKTTQLGKIVLTAHSGVYKATGMILKHGGLRENITDVHLFDATYGQLESFADWCALGGDRRLVSIFTEHLANENFELLTLLQQRKVNYDAAMEADMTDERLKQRTPILIHTKDLSHNDVVAKRDYFAQWLGCTGLPALE